MAVPFAFPTNQTVRDLAPLGLAKLPEWAPFTKGDMPSSQRNRLVDDGGVVWESTLFDTDIARGGDCRNEAWVSTADGGGYAEGQTIWAVFGLKLAADYATPATWACAGWQARTPVNSPPGYLNPMCWITSAGGMLIVRNEALGDEAFRTQYDRGRWHYFVISDLLSKTSGRIRVWHSLDVLPDTTQPPDGDVTCPTVPPQSGDGQPLLPTWTKNGQYRSKGTTGAKHVIYLDRPTEASSQAEAQALFRAGCRPAALGGSTPPPPVDTTLAALNREWAVFMEAKNAAGKRTQDETWRVQNPGEWSKLQAYRAGGVEPQLVTATGRRMVEHVTAWLLEQQ